MEHVLDMALRLGGCTKIQVSIAFVKSESETQINTLKNEAIEEIYGKSTRHGSVSRLADPRITFFKKNHKTPFFISSRGVCVPNFRSVSFFIWPDGPVQTNKATDTFTSKNLSILDPLLPGWPGGNFYL